MAKEQKINMQSMHFEFQLWLKELKFLEGEIEFFENQLGQLSSEMSDKEDMIKLERFQNKFIREKDVIDTYKNDIRRHEQALATLAKEGSDDLSNLLAGHKVLRERLESNRSIYNELKSSFFTFATH